MMKSLTHSGKSMLLLSFGFGLIIVLLVTVTSLGISYIQILSSDLSNVVNDYSRRTHLGHSMKKAARERSMILLEMLQSRDEFERDDLYQKMILQGEQFLLAREEIIRMELAENELNILKRQREQSKVAVSFQRNTFELLRDEKFNLAEKILFENAIPAQNNVLSSLDAFIQQQQNNNTRVFEETTKSFNETLTSILTFTAVGILISILVAVLVMKKINSTLKAQHCAEKDLMKLNSELEKRVEDRTRELNDVNKKLKHLATYDGITGLPNRLLFKDVAESLLANSIRHNKKMAIFFLDLDGFKTVNDTYGHDAGDLLLKEVSQRIQGNIRKDDLLARFGGDEFVIVVADAGEREHIEVVARKLIDCVAAPFDSIGNTCHVGVSIGISFFPENGNTIAELVKSADKAMYVTKKSGKNNYSFI